MLILRKRSRSMPALSTASLPDIVFILLFFFMVATHIRNENTSLPLPKVDFAETLPGDITWQLSVHPENKNLYLLNDKAIPAHRLIPALNRADTPGILQIFLDKNTPMAAITDLKSKLTATKIRKIEYMVFK